MLSSLDAECLRVQELVFIYLVEAVEIFNIRCLSYLQYMKA
jgi:hypothetical protein